MAKIKRYVSTGMAYPTLVHAQRNCAYPFPILELDIECLEDKSGGCPYKAISVAVVHVHGLKKQETYVKLSDVLEMAENFNSFRFYEQVDNLKKHKFIPETERTSDV